MVPVQPPKGFDGSSEDGVDRCRQGEIFFGDAAGIVAYQPQVDFVVAYVDVRMMARTFCCVCDCVDEAHCLAEIRERKSSMECAIFYMPVGY